MRRVRIGITMGDPAGVGPEVVCKALAALPAAERDSCVVIGSESVFERAVRAFAPEVKIGSAGGVPLIHVDTPDLDGVRDATVTAASGHAAYGYVERAVGMAMKKEIDAIVTAPISKAALHAAGHRYDGHTGLLKHLTGAKHSFMLFASDVLSVILVSTHVSLADAIRRVTTESVFDTILAGASHLRRIGIANPRIAVAGLNPHCGEGGLFGSEDDTAVAPAIAQAQEHGLDVIGPTPADTVFLRASRGEFDLVVAQYHDQGLIPVKLLAFDRAVNVTLGLPVLRTSVDHGTAFDIAWRGVADHTNMLAAIRYARRIVDSATRRSISNSVGQRPS